MPGSVAKWFPFSATDTWCKQVPWVFQFFFVFFSCAWHCPTLEKSNKQKAKWPSARRRRRSKRWAPLSCSRVCSHAAPRPHGGHGLRFLQLQDRVAVCDGLLSMGGAPWGGGGHYRTWWHPLSWRHSFFLCSKWSHGGHLTVKTL